MMASLLNHSIPENQFHDNPHPTRETDDDEEMSSGVGRMTTANFVLMFGILALVLLIIRAILMKVTSAKCRRKDPHGGVRDLQDRYMSTVRRQVQTRISNTSNTSGTSSISGHVPESRIFVLSPPSYDNNQEYPNAAPPPYSPGAPAPVFVDQTFGSFKAGMGASPPSYESIAHVPKEVISTPSSKSGMSLLYKAGNTISKSRDLGCSKDDESKIPLLRVKPNTGNEEHGIPETMGR